MMYMFQYLGHIEVGYIKYIKDTTFVSTFYHAVAIKRIKGMQLFDTKCVTYVLCYKNKIRGMCVGLCVEWHTCMLTVKLLSGRGLLT
jgi:hypothetical protein